MPGALSPARDTEHHWAGAEVRGACATAQAPAEPALARDPPPEPDASLLRKGVGRVDFKAPIQRSPPSLVPPFQRQEVQVAVNSPSLWREYSNMLQTRACRILTEVAGPELCPRLGHVHLTETSRAPVTSFLMDAVSVSLFLQSTGRGQGDAPWDAARVQGGAARPASRRQDGDILLLLWAGSSNLLLGRSVCQTECVPFSRSATEYQAQGLKEFAPPRRPRLESSCKQSRHPRKLTARRSGSPRPAAFRPGRAVGWSKGVIRTITAPSEGSRVALSSAVPSGGRGAALVHWVCSWRECHGFLLAPPL